MPISVRSAIPTLPVRSIPEAIAFYRALGFDAARYGEADDYAFLTRSSLELHLRRAPDLIPGQSPSGVYFLLSPGTAAQLEAEFRGRHVPILSAVSPRVWGMNEFVLSDPDGNLLRFGETVAIVDTGR